MCEAVSSAPFIPRTDKDIHSIEQEGAARLSLKIFHFQDSLEKKGNVFIFFPSQACVHQLKPHGNPVFRDLSAKYVHSADTDMWPSTPCRNMGCLVQ